MVHSVQLPLQTEADGFVHGRMDDQGLSLLAKTMEHQVRPATCQPRLDDVVVVVLRDVNLHDRVAVETPEVCQLVAQLPGLTLKNKMSLGSSCMTCQCPNDIAQV